MNLPALLGLAATTAIIFFCAFLFLKVIHPSSSLSYRAAGAGVLASAQIILTETWLGAGGWLSLPVLVTLNLGISLGGLAYLGRTPSGRAGFAPALIRQLSSGFKDILTWENAFLILLIILLTGWYTAASYLFPPRGVDDNFYHLPAVYEWILTQHISVLPVTVTPGFAYPMNAELLFLWPTIFIHSTHLIGLVQYSLGLWGLLIIYALGRSLGQDRKTAFFSAGLFIFAPVVLAQAGSGYIDLITGVFYLAGLFFVGQFYIRADKCSLYLAGLSIGLMVGMKYHLLFWAMVLHVLIARRLVQQQPATLLKYFGLLILCGGFWYARNLIVFQNPLFPINLSAGWGVIPAGDAHQGPVHFLPALIEKTTLLLRDAGEGSLHGGLGRVFWWIGFPAWIYLFFKSLPNRSRAETWSIFLKAQLLLGLVFLLFFPLDTFVLRPRYSLFVIAIGTVSIGELLRRTRHQSLSLGIKILCCLLTLWSFVSLPNMSLPFYDLSIARQPSLQSRKFFSKNKYLQHSPYLTGMGFAWELLDRLGQSRPQGLQCYLATEKDFFWSAPVYGTYLQNRVWNFSAAGHQTPDALLYYQEKTQPRLFVGPTITLESALLNAEYDLVLSTANSFLFIKKEIRQEPTAVAILAEFYQDYCAPAVSNLARQKISLPPDTPVIAYGCPGYALKRAEMLGQLDNPVFLIPPTQASQFVRDKNWPKVYSLDSPLPGFRSLTAAMIGRQSGPLYLNEK